MIISKTPFRMSFFGGGTDMEEYFRENGGAVLSTTFDKYCYVIARHLPRFFDYSTEIVYNKIERVTAVEDIEHPLVRNAMKMLDMREIRLSYEADLPARSGLGTSSSFAVGMLNAFHMIKGKQVDAERLATEAIKLERELCNEAGGWQDEIAAAYGGLNRIDFNADGYSVNPIAISDERKQKLNDKLMLFFTGFTRFSSDIMKEYVDTDSETKESKYGRLNEMKGLVGEAERLLEDESADLNDFGRMLDYTWQLKKGMGKSVSTSGIDEIYEAGRKAGALGGKLLGAGGGGFVVFYVEKDKQKAVAKAMNGLMHVPFAFENEGSQIIHYTPETYELID